MIKRLITLPVFLLWSTKFWLFEPERLTVEAKQPGLLFYILIWGMGGMVSIEKQKDDKRVKK